MRAPLSIVIPTLNAERHLGPCLGALFEGVQAGLVRELIVVDGGSGDATVEIAREVGAEVIEAAPSRGGQLRKGCAAARGEWFLVIHADSVLQEGWSEAVAAHIGAEAGKAGYFRLGFDAKGRAAGFVAGWANFRARAFGLPYGDQGICLRREMYDAVGGYPDIPLMEDVALVRAIGRAALVPFDAVAVTSAAKYQHQGWLRRGAGNLWTLLRYLAGVAPERLAAGYRR